MSKRYMYHIPSPADWYYPVVAPPPPPPPPRRCTCGSVATYGAGGPHTDWCDALEAELQHGAAWCGGRGAGVGS